MKKFIFLLAAFVNVPGAYSQDTTGIKINDMYMTHAQNRKWSIYLSPPLFAGNTLRHLLGKELHGKASGIPPAFFSFDINVQKFISDRVALGLQYQHSKANVTSAVLFDKTVSANALTDLAVQSDNLIFTGRYYYDIVIKNRWDPAKHPISAGRLRRSFRRLVMFSGMGLGFGKVRFSASSTGDYEYPQLKRLNKIVVGFEVIGLQYYFNKHWGAFFTFGTPNTGIYTSGHTGIFINP